MEKTREIVARIWNSPRKSLVILQVAWWAFILYAGLRIVLDLGSGSGLDAMRFERRYEDTFSFFSAWLTYFEFLRLVAMIRNFLAAYYLLVAIFIFIRRRTDRVGILTSIALIGVPVNWLFSAYEGAFGVLMVLWVYAFSYLLFVFPNGKFIPWKISGWINPLFSVFALGLIASNWEDWFFVIPLVSLGVLNLAGLVSQAYRYLRVSTLAEKQQMKWVFYSILFLVFWTIFAGVNPGGSLRFGARAAYGLFLVFTGFVVVLMIPVAFTVSIFRYRLFDIDLIIRRTLQYTLLTGMLGGIYYIVIVFLQAVVTALTGRQGSPVVTVVSTLLIAALFNPLRLRLQDFINRRFYRNAYNSERLLQGFAESARDEVDMLRLAESILAVAETAMQPEKTSLFLKERE